MSAIGPSVVGMDTTGTVIDWNTALVDQLDFHWQQQLRPRLVGLSDAEYFWEPVAGSWNVRRRAAGDTASPGTGAFTVDFVVPAPEPAPVTTIAWRLAHLIVGVLGMRNASQFAGPPVDYPDLRLCGHRGCSPDAARRSVRAGPMGSAHSEMGA